MDLELRALLDKEAITAVLHRRARATDERDLELSLNCYHEGATEDHEGYDGPIEEYLRTASPVFFENSPVEVCSHLIGNVEIDLDGDRAKCQCYFICCLTASEEGRRRNFINAGRYLDDFERRDGVWAITRRRCVYDWSRSDDASPPWWER
jgi:3-phenylpropionate/cinnamic acid dioxygenase small subunit